ncbi:unnamed protein product [Cochlearia groenlandica]
MQNSLGGDCKTLMFVHIRPSSTNLGENVCSLNFASMVRGIKPGPDVLKQVLEKMVREQKESEQVQLETALTMAPMTVRGISYITLRKSSKVRFRRSTHASSTNNKENEDNNFRRSSSNV